MDCNLLAGIVCHIAPGKNFGFIKPVASLKDISITQPDRAVRVLLTGRQISDHDLEEGDIIGYKAEHGTPSQITVAIEKQLNLYIQPLAEARAFRGILLKEELLTAEIVFTSEEAFAAGFYTARLSLDNTLGLKDVAPAVDIPPPEDGWMREIISQLSHTHNLTWLLQHTWLPVRERYPQVASYTLTGFCFHSWIDTDNFDAVTNAVSELCDTHDGLADLLRAVRKSGSTILLCALWLQGIAVRPTTDTQSKINGWKYCIATSDESTLLALTTKLLHEIPTDRLTAKALSYLLEQRLAIADDVACDNIIKLLSAAPLVALGITLEEDDFRAARPGYLIRLWLCGQLQTISKGTANAYLETADTADVAQLGPARCLELLAHSHSSVHTTEFKSALQQFLDEEVPPVLVLDIESNGATIQQLAWHYRGALTDLKNVDEGIAALNALLLQERPIVAGHNIVAWDIPILKKAGLLADNIQTIDTLLLETVLHPTRKSHALRTAHNAATDAQLTHRLLCTQLARLCIADIALVNALAGMLPTPVCKAIHILRSRGLEGALAARKKTFSGDDFFHKERSPEAVPAVIADKLKESRGRGQLTVVPAVFWPQIAASLDMLFLKENNVYGQVLSGHKLLTLKDEAPWLWLATKQYAAQCAQSGQMPILARLSAYLRQALQDVAPRICMDAAEALSAYPKAAVCIAPGDATGLTEKTLGLHEALIIAPMLARQSSIRLLAELDMKALHDRLPDRPVWLQFAGGDSFIALQPGEAAKLALKQISEGGKYWLQRTGRSRFRVWQNGDLTTALTAAGYQSIHDAEWPQTARSLPLRAVLGRDSSGETQRSVNPETFYRSLYWTYAAKLISRQRDKRPIVLLIERYEETGIVSEYFRRLGYYVPPPEAGLRRKLELLCASRKSDALMPLPLAQLEEVLQWASDEPFHFIRESLRLAQSALLSPEEPKLDRRQHGLALAGEAEGGGDSSEDSSEVSGADSDERYNIFRGLQAELTIAQHQAAAIAAMHPQSSLTLLDPRVGDYPGLNELYGIAEVRCETWARDEEYKHDLGLAQTFFGDDGCPSDVNTLSITEAKDFLRPIMLPEGAGWSVEQEQYFDAILPMEQHVLVSLPTGGGKSVLFQGPALLQGGTSSRLSIVVVPLKSLMEDQVKGLSEKGFYTNVDYISGDRQPYENREVLRRTAGGELTLLYITPERFRSRAFIAALETRFIADGRLAYFVFDEAHCISQWGQEFRPDFFHAYQQAKHYLKTGSEKLCLLLFSATISEQVFADISRDMPPIARLQLFESGYNPVRDHIRMSFLKGFAEEDRLTPIIAKLNEASFNPAVSRAIVFTTSRAEAEESAMALSERLIELSCSGGHKDAFNVDFYHAGLSGEQREQVYKAYKDADGRLPFIFATKAFGMGVDIGNIHHVFHYSPPSALEDFLQEVGRAGRDKRLLTQRGYSLENPIDAVTLLSSSDFSKVKRRMKEAKLAWKDIEAAQTAIHQYLGSLGPLQSDVEKSWPVPLNLMSAGDKFFREEVAQTNKFRLSLFWLEQLRRIELGFFTPTHYKVLRHPLKEPDDASKDLRECLRQIRQQAAGQQDNSDAALISISALSNALHVPVAEVISQLAKLQKEGCIKLEHYIYLVPSVAATDEFTAFVNNNQDEYLVKLHWAFLLAEKILKGTTNLDEKDFGEEEMKSLAQEALEECSEWLHQSIRGSEERFEKFKADLKSRRRHVFALLRTLPGVRVKSIITGITAGVGGRQHSEVVQRIYNGFGTGREAKAALNKLRKHTAALCEWAYKNSRTDVTGKMCPFEYLGQHLSAEKMSFLEDLLHITGLFGYIKTAGSIMPTGIGMKLLSDEPLAASDSLHPDKQVYDAFVEWGKLRELKMIALQALTEMPQESQDAFIKAYFNAKSYPEILGLLYEALQTIQRDANRDVPEAQLPPHPAMAAFREAALNLAVYGKEDEQSDLPPQGGLSVEQLAVYNAPIDRHISVIAGPGSGKTHTLSLRVARLIQKEDVSPSDILVVAYNRAVVTELKARLQKLFRALGYEDITRPLRICTYAELALKMNPDIRQQPFQIEGNPNVWERDLHAQLMQHPGLALSRLGGMKHVLVDEFQDATVLRIEILEALIRLGRGCLFVIGDPNQSIYGYERLKAGTPIDPAHYYGLLKEKFSQAGLSHYVLSQNFRSMPNIVDESNTLIADWIPRYEGLKPLTTTRQRLAHMPEAYCTIRLHSAGPHWTEELRQMLTELGPEGRSGGGEPYRQIAILFRSNNEVFRANAKLQGMAIQGIRIRVQGNQPTEFSRFRECHFFLQEWEKQEDTPLPVGFVEEVAQLAERAKAHNAWNQFYLSAIQALALQYWQHEEGDARTYANLCEHIRQSTRRDDGLLWKVYNEYKDDVDKEANQTEVLLTTMHRVKGLEFDAVLIPPSFSELPFMPGTNDAQIIKDLIDEERRLMYVAYSRARFRLVVVQSDREVALLNHKTYELSEADRKQIGTPLKDGLKDVKIGWGAYGFVFAGNQGANIPSNKQIGEKLKAGTPLKIVRSVKPHGIFYEVKTEKGLHVATIANVPAMAFTEARYEGYFVNEVIVWTEAMTLREGFADLWCAAAQAQGYIYVVAIAGYGRPPSNPI